MSGYLGNADAESEHALILSENGIEASRQAMVGAVLEYCVDCGDKIDERRVEALRKNGMKCECCVDCQQDRDRLPKPQIKMLDRIL